MQGDYDNKQSKDYRLEFRNNNEVHTFRVREFLFRKNTLPPFILVSDGTRRAQIFAGCKLFMKGVLYHNVQCVGHDQDELGNWTRRRVLWG